MTEYTSVFGGANIYPSDISYSFLELEENTTLYWPLEANAGAPLLARIMDVEPAEADLVITLDSAEKVAPGETVVFTNVGAFTFTVEDADGTQLLSVAPGIFWQLYLTDNTTEAGEWNSLQFGSTTSVAQASALAGTGLKAVGTRLRQNMPVIGFNSNYSLGATDAAYTFVWLGTGAGTLELPDPTAAGDGWFIAVRNSGGGSLTVSRAGIDIDGLSARTYPPASSSLIICDGTEFYTVGFNVSSITNFDYTVIDVSGSGNYVLSGAELNRIGYRFIGTLTGNKNVIVPAVAQEYWVDNQTDGAYDLTVKPLAGTGVVVGQDARRILYCDGADVVDADNTNISVPLSIAQGGTGSTTAAGARINLGAGSVGNALFQAETEDDAWAAIGGPDGGEF